jgi:hypothetical protein
MRCTPLSGRRSYTQSMTSRERSRGAFPLFVEPGPRLRSHAFAEVLHEAHDDVTNRYVGVMNRGASQRPISVNGVRGDVPPVARDECNECDC